MSRGVIDYMMLNFSRQADLSFLLQLIFSLRVEFRSHLFHPPGSAECMTEKDKDSTVQQNSTTHEIIQIFYKSFSSMNL